MTDELQFYPTPERLARKAWSMFSNKNPTRILEPSAGRGDLLKTVFDDPYGPYGRATIDAIEINIEFHPLLREKKCRVVATDFLSYRAPIPYSHIIMNPPFRNGVDHVLHAWDLLRDGELVAIINAETIKNPCSEKRKLLIKLIADHGEVEFVDSAFEDPDTLRRTSVQVALVHLTRKSGIEIDIKAFGLSEDRRDETVIDEIHALAIPEGTIRNTVRAFNAAVKAMEASVRAEAVAGYYQGLIKMDYLSDSKDSVDPEKTMHGYVPFAKVAETVAERYDQLKEHAWRRVLSCADFTSRFSRKVQESIHGQLNELMQMEFTVENIHAVLEGLMQSKTELDLQMLEEVFDLITEYHTENRSHYRGWKSNDKHRLGFKIRSTRFILPRMKNWSGDGIDWEGKRIMADIDRVFALLDGKSSPTYSMEWVADHQKHDLAAGERVSSDYFDLRFYPGIGTVHFFPRRKDLVERLNRMVGHRRQWLPDQPADAPDTFWSQYEQADKVQSKVDKLIKEDRRPSFARVTDDEIFNYHAEACADLGLSLEFKDETPPTENDGEAFELTPSFEGGVQRLQGGLHGLEGGLT